MTTISDTLHAALRSEFDAADGSFLLQLRCDLRWDKLAFTRMTEAMHEYCRSRTPHDDIPRWIACGFWFVESFVRDWSTHPSFPREPDDHYYNRAYTRLHDLSYLLFMGESLYEDPKTMDVRI